MSHKTPGRVLLAAAALVILAGTGFLFWRWSFPTVSQAAGWESRPDVLSLRVVVENADIWYDFEGGDALDDLVALLEPTRLGRRERTDQVFVGYRLLLGTREEDKSIHWYDDLEFDGNSFVCVGGWRYSVPQEAEAAILSQLVSMTDNGEGRSQGSGVK